MASPGRCRQGMRPPVAGRDGAAGQVAGQPLAHLAELAGRARSPRGGCEMLPERLANSVTTAAIINSVMAVAISISMSGEAAARRRLEAGGWRLEVGAGGRGGGLDEAWLICSWRRRWTTGKVRRRTHFIALRGAAKSRKSGYSASRPRRRDSLRRRDYAQPAVNRHSEMRRRSRKTTKKCPSCDRQHVAIG